MEHKKSFWGGAGLLPMEIQTEPGGFKGSAVLRAAASRDPLTPRVEEMVICRPPAYGVWWTPWKSLVSPKPLPFYVQLTGASLP